MRRDGRRLSHEGAEIRRGTKTGSFAAVAAFALAIGGISAALLTPDVTLPGTIITAGHLRVQINHGHGSDLSIDNLAPGDTRVAYQLITGDMGGIDSADLSMTVSSAADTPFTRHASLSVAVSNPVPDDSSRSVDCSGSAFRKAALAVAAMSSLTRPSTVSLGTLTSTHDAVCVRFTIGLNRSAGNSVQGTSGSLAMRYSLAQNAVTR